MPSSPSPNSKLLILDLDETLIYASEQPLPIAPDFAVGGYHVYTRPHLARFLERCTAHFELAVWTSSTADYARAVLAHIKPPDVHFSFVWARDRCTRKRDLERQTYVWIKDLKKVKKQGYALEQVIVVDDSPEKLARHYGNLVCVRPFTGDAGDEELMHLADYLLQLAGVENVRRVEKRGWRTHVSSAPSPGSAQQDG
ncbi:MAG: NIF family HAD-type phosphatase [Candidatus Binatia bacterium]